MHKLYLTVYADGVYGDFVINPSGVMTISSAAPLEAKSFTSLDGISFPAAPATGRKLTLLNGWVSSQRQYHSGDPAYWVSNGVVHFGNTAARRYTSLATISYPVSS